MAVRTRRNQYPGINAHLHSHLQSHPGWSGFHTLHIGDLYRALGQQLLPMGYVARLEESLQVRRVDSTVYRPRADVLILDTEPGRRAPASPTTSTAGWTLSVEQLLADVPVSDRPYSALAVYPLGAAAGDDSDDNPPVTWVELLSPSNKGKVADRAEYQHKRQDLLTSGLVFVELDYLHETPPTFPIIPDYRPPWQPDETANQHPYRIIVIDPRPDFASGQAQVIGFAVDDPLPTVSIPLAGDDVLAFDFGVPYSRTYTESFFGVQEVDYASYPVHFSSYSTADQTRIARRMLAVLTAQRDGLDLEAHAPLPVSDVSDVPLAEALKQVDLLRERLSS